MGIRSNDGFDDFRKERKRMQARTPVSGSPLGYENKALRELEQVEAREVRDQQLTREVHDFFQHATRQAATIVEKVARDAQEQAGVRVEQEMESFLMDALARMNAFVMTVMNQRRPPVAEAKIEPCVANIVGDSLDEFRWEGTAEVGDKHIGQDPFDTDVEEVRRQFRAEIGPSAPDDTGSVPIEEHLVAAVQPPAEDDDRPLPGLPSPPTPGPTRITAAPGAVKGPAAPLPVPPAMSGVESELDRFKTALKKLVMQGTMSREEARAAWQTRLQTLKK